MYCISIHTATFNKPEINGYTPSPHQVQPSDQIILRAEAITTNSVVHGTWYHGNTTYSQPLRKDPSCQVRIKFHQANDGSHESRYLLSSYTAYPR